MLKKLNQQKRGKFQRKYGVNDIALLVKTDLVHSCLNGKATKIILKREYEVYGKEEYKKISEISVAQIYNIRNNNQQYISSDTLYYNKTKSNSVDIGIRQKPEPNGHPGYLRVDSVHQGDRDGKKGVYHINLVDEVNQMEILCCVERISEFFMRIVLEDAFEQFPYEIVNFHSDNGSEYINKQVSDLLNKLLIRQTKSRSRKTNDNALVESKNRIIRKHMGRNYIDQKHAPLINEFYKKYFNIYLNYHRVCAFPEEKINSKGKIIKSYPLCNYMTPYDKLKSIPDIESYLKPGIDLKDLERIALTKSDNEFAEEMQKAKKELFEKIRKIDEEGLSKLLSKF